MPVRIDPLTGDMRYDADVVGAVTSVFGRTGAVVAATDDYTWAQIDKTLSDLADLTTRSHTDLTDIGTNTHAQIDTHIGDTTIHFLEASIDHGSIGGLTDVADHPDYILRDGTRTFSAFIDIDEAAVPDTPAANVMRLYAEDFHGFPFLSFKDDGGMVRKLVRDSVFLAYNNRGTTIAAGRIVYASGAFGDVPTINTAKADSTATMPAIGVTVESIADGAYGRVMQVGLLENVNTSAYSAGDVLYVSATTAGIPTATAPLYPNLRQEIGTILISDASVGAIQLVARTVQNDGVIDHGGLLGLADDDHTQYLLADGTRALSAAWDAGSFKITAETFESDVAGGTAPFTVASNTLVTNLNADLLDGNEAAAFAAAAHVHAAGDITSGTLAVAQGGTNLASGTDGGILGYTAVGVLASSVLLTANALILGGGAGATPIPLTAGLGTTVTVLHGNAGGEPTWGAVDLTADITGTLPYSNGGTGQTTWAQGDLLYASAADTLALLNVGGANTVLVSNGTVPGWSATLAGLTLTSPTIGDFTNAAHDHEAAGGGGQLDHNAALTNLATGDVHTHYLLLAGRTGATNDFTISTDDDANIVGSNAASADLYIHANDNDQDGLVRLQDELYLREDFPTVSGSVTKYAAQWTPTISLTGGALTTPTAVCLNLSPTLTRDSAGIISYYRAVIGGGTFSPTAGGPFSWQMFRAQPTLQSNSTVTPGSPLVYVDTVTLRSYGSSSNSVDSACSFYSTPTVNAEDTTTFALASFCGYVWNPTISEAAGASLTITSASGMNISNPTTSGSPTITTLSGVVIGNLTAGTTNLSVQSSGSAVQMRHAGPAVFGANAAPTNDSVGLEVQSTTKALLLSSMTQAQRDTLTGVAVADGMCLYNSTAKSTQVRANGSWVATPGWDIVIIKSAYQVVTNNSTLQDDTELQFSVLANEAWIVELLLGMMGSNTTGDGKVGLTASVATFTTSHSNWEGVYYNAAGALTSTTPTGFASTTEAVTGGTTCINGDGLYYPVHLIYRFQATANATVKVQFANSTAGAGWGTYIYGGSTLRAKRLLQ